jgi:hypothetical protein
MWRIIAFALVMASSAHAQVGPRDVHNEGLPEQLLPESFKLTASAVAQKIDFGWETAVTYQLVNNSGMPLVMGIAAGSVSIGRCTDIMRARGGMMLLPSAFSQAIDLAGGPPRAVTVPAGARVAGTMIAMNCEAPNPGFPTAQLSMTLMIAKNQQSRSMVDFPLSVEADVRQVR